MSDEKYRKVPVQTSRVHWICQDEGCTGEMEPTGTIYDVYPAQYGHACNACKREGVASEIYPKIVHEEIPVIEVEVAVPVRADHIVATHSLGETKKCPRCEYTWDGEYCHQCFYGICPRCSTPLVWDGESCSNCLYITPEARGIVRDPSKPHNLGPPPRFRHLHLAIGTVAPMHEKPPQEWTAWEGREYVDALVNEINAVVKMVGGHLPHDLYLCHDVHLSFGVNAPVPFGMDPRGPGAKPVEEWTDQEIESYTHALIDEIARAAKYKKGPVNDG